MPLGPRRRRPVARAAVVGTVAYKAGKSGAQREDEAQAAAPPPPEESPPADEPVDPTTEKINQLVELHASGALTDEEFAAAKAKALGID